MGNTRRSVPARTMTELGLVLRTQRKALGWSQAELADRIHMSRKWVVDAESGKPTLAVEPVLRALAAVGVVLEVPLVLPIAAPASSTAAAKRSAPTLPPAHAKARAAGKKSPRGSVNLDDILAKARAAPPPTSGNRGEPGDTVRGPVSRRR